MRLQYLFRRRGRLHKALTIIVILLLCMAIIFLWCVIDHRIRPSAERLCEEQCRYILSQAIADGVEETLLALSEMDVTLTTTQKDVSGLIVSMDANSHTMNLIQTMLLQNVNAALRKQERAAFHVPIGSLTGLYTISGKGPSIPLRFFPAGSASVRLESSLSSAGINQTLYRLTAVITAHASCAVPMYQAEVTTEFSYLFSESFIVGEVPFSS